MKKLLFIPLLLCLVGWGPFSFLFDSPIPYPEGSSPWVQQESRKISSYASNINPKVLNLSLKAYLKMCQRGFNGKKLLTIIDYSKPSSEKRLWVIDLKTGRVLFNTWVTHGKNSGLGEATSFSNQVGSLKSSIGLFMTTNETYTGNVGYALRMTGLEHGINDNAYKRAIVFHGAWYAKPDNTRRYGALGRSWGCPAVSEELARPIINTIRGRSLVFAYYPDRNWLNHSSFLAG